MADEEKSDIEQFDEMLKRPLWQVAKEILVGLKKGGAERKEWFEALADTVRKDKERGIGRPEDQKQKTWMRKLIHMFVGKDAAKEYDDILDKDR
jgi:hypothetical protein